MRRPLAGVDRRLLSECVVEDGSQLVCTITVVDVRRD